MSYSRSECLERIEALENQIKIHQNKIAEKSKQLSGNRLADSDIHHLISYWEKEIANFEKEIEKWRNRI